MAGRFLSFICLLASLNTIGQEGADTSVYQKLDNYITSAHAVDKFNGTAFISQHGRGDQKKPIYICDK
jgi:hypothetical protein